MPGSKSYPFSVWWLHAAGWKCVTLSCAIKKMILLICHCHHLHAQISKLFPEYSYFFFCISCYTFLHDVKFIDILLAFVLFFFSALFWLYCWFTRHWFTLLNHIENEIVSIIHELIFSFHKPTSCFVTFLCSSATEHKMYLSYLLPWQLSCKALIYFFK